mgnify:CR=1 FL=1
MYPKESVSFLDKQSCSNLYSLKKALKTNTCSIALGAGASASVGLPTWKTFLVRICFTFFYHWAFDVYYKKNNCSYSIPPRNMSIAFVGFYELYMQSKEKTSFSPDFEIYKDGKKLSKEQVEKFITNQQEQEKLIELLQDDFMEKILAHDPVLIAQMIKNRVRPKDWDYLLRKSLYNSFEYNKYNLKVSTLYKSLCKLINNYKIKTIINYNYDDTLYHSLKHYGISVQNIYDGKHPTPALPSIFYPHGYIPMCGGVKTEIVLAEQDYQKQGLRLDLWANNIQISTYCSTPTIFVGLSLSDVNLRRILNQCRSASSSFHYAFLPCSGNTPTTRMIDSLYDSDLYRLGIKVIRYPKTKNTLNAHELLPKLFNFLNEP